MRTTTAALPANIEALQRELDEARRREAATADELQARTRELSEALQQQTATADVLKAISRSTFDLQNVLDTLVESAARLCAADRGAINRRDGDVYRTLATHGLSAEQKEYFAAHPLTAGPGSVTGRAGLEGKAVHVPDVLADPAYGSADAQRVVGYRTILGVPMLRDGTAIGVFALLRHEVNPFTDKQIELVTTFADQAVIAIENARLFDEVQARTRDLSEALQQQTATANVLKVISRSAFDLDAVFATLTSSAAELIGGSMGTIATRDGDVFRYRSFCGLAPATMAFLTEHPAKPGRKSAVGRVALSGEVVRVRDVLDDNQYAVPASEYRSILAVPLLRDETVEGVFSMARAEPGDFTPRQVELLQTFADQAVIAIENIRLFDEVQAKTRDLSEALQQQIATADVLKVISRSAFDLQTVLDTLAESAARLCAADKSAIGRREGDVYRTVALHGFSSGFKEYMAAHPVPAGGGSVTGRAGDEGKAVHVADVLADPAYGAAGAAREGGFRTVLGVPLMRDGMAIGVFTVMRGRVNPFTDKQIELATTFADQAVIAIENARLFEEVQARTRELEESLQQQTATADVLKVISRSAFDLQNVLDTLVESAARLCAADQGAISRRDKDVYWRLATHGYSDAQKEYVAAQPLAAGRGSVTGRAGLEGKAVHVPDVLADPEYTVAEAQLAGIGYRTALGVPLMRDGTAMGVFALVRHEVNPFTDKQIELVATFADQAIIAIENARLFEEVQARTRDLEESLQQQTATANVLKVISRSAFDLQAVFDTLINSAVELIGGANGTICLRHGDVFRYRAHSNMAPELVAYLDAHPATPGRGSSVGRVLLSGRVECLPDVLNDKDYVVPTNKLNRTRSILAAPLLRNDAVEGALVITRAEPGDFTQRQIEIVQTFADQAVIAIENARLFDEVQARTRELTQSLDDLRNAQDRLIQTEKLASLGQLTAGIAHEIKNPLNFVNNFADLSRELLGELEEVVETSGAGLGDGARAEIGELTGMLKSNLEKVAQHGRRADSIVKNMLLHSREGGGERRRVDLNALVEEALNLAYHGARAEKPGFNVTLGKTLDATVGSVEIFPQEFTRVLLNLISNGFYAAQRKKPDGGPAFEPSLAVSTKALPARVEIRIRDNGTGIPDSVKAKMFNPFFTTKPAGEGTGLGLSLSHDIIVKQHGGSLDVDTKVGEFTEFTIGLPRAAAAAAKRGDRP